ncbi:MAG: FecR domain-containing protein [Burkholderiaceae bacterium]
MKRLRALWSAVALAAGLVVAPAAAQSVAGDPGQTSVVIYQVNDGESLTGIANHLLKPDFTWRHLRAFNQLPDADRLRPGQQLRVPRTWLRDESLQAFVREASGTAQVDGQQARSAARLQAGSRIVTGPDGVVVVVLPDGTSVRVAPESDVLIERLRRAYDTQGLDAGFDIRQGEVTVDSPAPADSRSKRRIELRSPKAIAAVRGTRFRVRETDANATNAVLRGSVAWLGRDTERLVPAGFGSSADAQGRTTEPEPLLPAPKVVAPGDDPVRTPTADIRFEPVSGARAYRILITRDADAVKAVRESVLLTNAYAFESPEDGPFYIHVRAVSATGIEGYSQPVRFVVSARPLPPPIEPGRDDTDDDGVAMLRWPARDDAIAYEIQVSDSATFDRTLFERRVDQPGYEIDTDLLAAGPGTWFWRVASIGADERPGPFTRPRELVRAVTGPAVTAEVDLATVTLSWSLPAEGNPVLMIDPLSQGASPARQHRVEGTRETLESLAPGRYRASMVLDFAGGRRSQPGPATQFAIPLLLRDGSGQPVQSSTGPMRMIAP